MKNIEKYEMEVLNNVDYCQLETELVSMGVYTRGLCRYSECKECKRRLRAWLFEEYKESILDEVERKYLSEVIKPFRKEVAYIKKDCTDAYFIVIAMKHDCAIYLPSFPVDSSMYKGMKSYRRYTIEELGL